MRFIRNLSGLRKFLRGPKLDSDLKGDPPPIRFSSNALPALPVEIWHRIIMLAVRLPCTLSTRLADPFRNGAPIYNSEQELQESRLVAVKVQLVCRAWRVVAIRLLHERYVLCCTAHTTPLVKALENSKARGCNYGVWTKELECRRGR